MFLAEVLHKPRHMSCIAFFGLLGMAKHRMGTTKGPEITFLARNVVLRMHRTIRIVSRVQMTL